MSDKILRIGGVFLVGILCLSITPFAEAQTFYSANQKPISTSYYMDLNNDSRSFSIPDLPAHQLSFKYEDRSHNDGALLLQIFDWKNEQKGVLSISKQFGLNYYDVNLKDLSEEWEQDVTYFIRYVDNDKMVKEVPFRLVSPPESKEISLSVYVNPIRINCASSGPSSISFVGRIDNGRPPFSLTWYVIDSDQSALLFLPKEDKIEVGETSMITLDAALSYHVLLHVEDACGNVGKQMVHVKCDEETDQINTLYLQPLQNPGNLIQGNR